MGITNFHSASQLLARAGEEDDLQALIQHFGIRVYVNYTSFSKEVVEAYTWRLQYLHLDQWVAPSEDLIRPITITKTPDPLKVPQLCISPIFRHNNLSSQLDYIFLVQGNRGANQKLILRHDLHGAGATVFHEAMNGFSVVFSGAVPKTAFRAFLADPGISSDSKLEFVKAKSIEELIDILPYELVPYGSPAYKIPILC